VCYNSALSFIQFHCENGRIILALKRFEWNKSDISSKFALLSSADFVKKWDDEMRSHMPSQAEGRKRCRSEKSPTPSSSKQPQPRSLPLLSTPASPPDTCIVSGSPAKRCKYIKEDIDESIQLSKKGDNDFILLNCTSFSRYWQHRVRSLIIDLPFRLHLKPGYMRVTVVFSIYRITRLLTSRLDASELCFGFHAVSLVGWNYWIRPTHCTTYLFEQKTA